MDAKAVARKAISMLMFSAALLVLLGGYLAASTSKNESFAVLGAVVGLVLIVLASWIGSE